ncbi:AAA family ATPase [Flammeovirga kamogawensis]|uniref:AAA family ATPase n=1 Tax=Flammeovirga kamogawensis TaxID=373891 RepID=A0ABX8H4C2_9BACT|nr:AAA family ATPase [Flammeovirga kamogawensis]MBB6461984.1 putative kinase [Flammeovirga kamogawensis]QWG10412.1 AAA family ATPase [Flammeovirga kamogawensis]TRX63922.1 AAA family ATPase [Flammeovirga kamogawensis]
MKKKKTILFILSGLPASGKSTLSKLIAQHYKALYLRIDTVEQGLRDLLHCKVEGEGYRLSYRIASDNLKLGLNVIADSCNPIVLTRKEWDEVAISNNAIPINIEVICSDKKEHENRVQTRSTEVENLILPTWIDIQERTFSPWEKGRILIDTSNKTITATFDELISSIDTYLANNF